MHDQANKLRELAFTATVTAPEAAAQVPMVVVTGAKAAVGATTVAVNLAATLADRGMRVVVVDAAQHRNDLGKVADIERDFEYSVADVVASKCGAAEAMVTSPGGMRVLASRGRVSPRLESASRRDSSTCDSRGAQQRLLAELETIGEDVDLVVVDAGYGLTAWSRRFWLRAALVVLVTTNDDASMLAAYTAIKLSSSDGIRPALRVLANQAASDHAADDVHRRLESSCRRFLSLSVEALPALPRHDDESNAGAPRVWEAPHSTFGHAALWLGRAVSDALADENRLACATACGEPNRVETLTGTARC